MNSDRIAPFRTHTVQSPYSMYMSPNPYHVLDGDHTFVPDETPTFDQVADGLTSQLEFATERLKTFKETKLRREVIMKRLQKVHGRRDELRREMFKPCGLFTATSHRSWLLDRRHQELEKLAQDKARNPTIVLKTSQTDQKKQKEPSDQEEEMEQKNPTSFANLRGSVSREREDWNSSGLNKDSS
eukprot:GABU01004274.1.p1 GENE.GABU01004274.1~~GABU01004274.1.p1  ORF type:complete len:204 (-),score=33.73 GABU01004274.1:53-607(-)